MEKIAISVFKANALRIIDRVSKEKKTIIITKRGRELAELIPCRSSCESPKPGKLSRALVYEKDIISPLGGGIWKANK